MILLASAFADRLDRWERGLQGLAPLRKTTAIDLLGTSLARFTPEVLVLDLGLPGASGPIAVAGLRKSNPATRIIAMSGPVSDETEVALFRVGVRGCCRIDSDPQLLKRVVLAVRTGELWIRRSLMPQLLDALGSDSEHETPTGRAMVGRLGYLTQREREIAALVAHGGSNKQIARRLAITERTVKAHLTEVFRKLGVADRLRLALLWVGTFDAPPPQGSAAEARAFAAQ